MENIKLKNNVKNDLVRRESKYSIDNYNGKLTDCYYQTGCNPILIHAPHATKHMRFDSVKKQDLYTGSISEIISRQAKCYCFNRTSRYIEDTEYLNKLVKFIITNKICAMIELHGMSYTRDYDVDLCINNGDNLCGDNLIFEKIRSNLNVAGISTSVDYYFKADKDYCACKYIAQEINIPAIELEINYRFRNFNDYIDNVEKLVDCIVKAIT